MRPIRLAIAFAILVELMAQEEYPKTCIPPRYFCMYGINIKSGHGVKFDAYLGVPYALPPIQQLRFKDPKELVLDKLDTRNTLLAMTDRPPCLQWKFRFEDSITGIEDCLYLNVYLPQKPVGSVSIDTTIILEQLSQFSTFCLV